MSGQRYPFNSPGLSSGTAFLVAVLAFVCAAQAMGDNTCAPRLAVSDVYFTEMQPPTLSRTWSAVVSVDASKCAAKGTGTFEIVFVREKETAPDLEFRKRFVWRAPSVKVQVVFDADEAVQSYRIENVMSCVCGG